MKRLLCMFLLGWILFRSRHWDYLRQLTITTQQGDVEKRRRNDLVRGAPCTPYAVVVGITLRLSVSGLDSLSIIHARTHLMSLVNEGGCITILFCVLVVVLSFVLSPQTRSVGGCAYTL